MKTAPVVFFSVSDPVANGFVPQLAKPGGNATGFSLYPYEMAGKWLQLLKEAAPGTRRVVAIMGENNPNTAGWKRSLEKAAASLRLELAWQGPRSTADLEAALASAAKSPRTGVITLADPFLTGSKDRHALLESYWRVVPGLTSIAGGGQKGSLIAFDVDRSDTVVRAAGYVARILRGEKPGNLPVQAPVTYKLTINRATARALKLQLPASLLAQADTLID